MGKMKEYYMQLLEEGKLRDPELEQHHDQEYWEQREYWEEVARQQQKEEDNDDN